jgi:hypothetical protein
MKSGVLGNNSAVTKHHIKNKTKNNQWLTMYIIHTLQDTSHIQAVVAHS